MADDERAGRDPLLHVRGTIYKAGGDGSMAHAHYRHEGYGDLSQQLLGEVLPLEKTSKRGSE